MFEGLPFYTVFIDRIKHQYQITFIFPIIILLKIIIILLYHSLHLICNHIPSSGIMLHATVIYARGSYALGVTTPVF
jgi:hypothetical protein